MTVGKNNDRGAKLQILRNAREPGERDERIVERRRILRVDVGSDGDVIGNHNEVVAERFNQLRPSFQRCWVRAWAEVQYVHADFHLTSVSRRRGKSRNPTVFSGFLTHRSPDETGQRFVEW